MELFGLIFGITVLLGVLKTTKKKFKCFLDLFTVTDPSVEHY